MKKLTTFNKIIAKRTTIQVITGILVYASISYYNLSLWYLLIIGIIIGVIFGKVFCRWMCPMGFIMEMLMGASPDQKLKNMYMYHKIGCPIAWFEGFLNKISFWKIKLNTDSCSSCGICDKQCYISILEPEKYSLYKQDKERPGESYTCSKCLSCVSVCPNGSLKYTFKKVS